MAPIFLSTCRKCSVYEMVFICVWNSLGTTPFAKTMCNLRSMFISLLYRMTVDWFETQKRKRRQHCWSVKLLLPHVVELWHCIKWRVSCHYRWFYALISYLRWCFLEAPLLFFWEVSFFQESQTFHYYCHFQNYWWEHIHKHVHMCTNTNKYIYRQIIIALFLFIKTIKK